MVGQLANGAGFFLLITAILAAPLTAGLEDVTFPQRYTPRSRLERPFLTLFGTGRHH